MEQNHMELAMDFTLPQKIQVFLFKAMRNQLPTNTFLSFGRQHVDSHCPRCKSPETTLHILQDCP